ncbi:MAG: FIST N-terminal domain-containing protein, partial [Desulfobacterales bacterium]
MLQAATVTSMEKFTRVSGQHLAEGLIGELNRPPNACWLFCAPQKGIEELLAGIYDVLRMDTIIGCTTDGEISNQGLTTETAVLGGIAADELHFHVVVAEGLGSHGETAGRRLARALPPSIRYVQLFSDGLSGNGCALLRG